MPRPTGNSRAFPFLRLAVFCGLSACTLAVGCESVPHDATPGLARAAVEIAQQGRYFDVAFTPAPSWDELRSRSGLDDSAALADRFLRELAGQSLPYWSSGSITVPLTDQAAEEESDEGAAGRRLRGTCGATLISPSLAVTAGHCVRAGVAPSTVPLQLYRPTALLSERYLDATRLQGEWPDLSHPELTEADGYFVDEYTCKVIYSCLATRDAECDAADDVALLECEGRPGDTYGFVNVHWGDPSGAESLMHWKHELLDPSELSEQGLADFADHYSSFGVERDQNFHYFEQQLLPLRSIPWSDGEPTRFLSGSWAENLGCHGTSGSGLLVRAGSSAAFELAGPVATGAGLAGSLCHALEGDALASEAARVGGLSFAWADPKEPLRAYAARFAEDCRAREPPAEGSERDFAGAAPHVSTVFSHLNCQVADFARDGVVLSEPLFGPYPEKYVETEPSTELEVEGFSLREDADYRLGLHVLPGSPCTQDCGGIEASIELVGAEAGASPAEVARPHADSDLTLVPDPARSSAVAVTFSGEQSGPVALRLISRGQSRALGGVVLIREGKVNAFDTPEDRLEALLQPVSAGGALSGPVPMRFVGDGEAGFAALLLPDERMYLSRQALARGQLWTLRLGADSYQDLTCGLLDMGGEPVQRVPCGPFFQVDDRAGSEGRLGVFVELAADSTRSGAVLRYLAIASGGARDGDRDGAPDVLDNCPTQWNPTQRGCDADGSPSQSDESTQDQGDPVPDSPGQGGADAGMPDPDAPASGLVDLDEGGLGCSATGSTRDHGGVFLLCLWLASSLAFSGGRNRQTRG